MGTVIRQLHRNAVALISLFIAVASLSYNTWRNEQTEANRNIRHAGIETLLKLGELDRLTFLARFDQDAMLGNPRIGWAYVLTMRDLGTLLPPSGAAATIELLETWSSNWATLAEDDQAYQSVSDAIETTRDNVLDILASLD